MRIKLLALVTLTTLASACGPKSQVIAPQEGVTELKYILVQEGITGLVAQVKKPKMSACITGISSADKKEWEDKIKSIVIKWVDTMRKLTSDPLTSGVDVNLDGRGCDVDITVAGGVWANTEIGQHPTVNMGDSGYMASYNTMLHEFGHAFALGDTYQNGQSGNCQPGQPQAVMCNTSFDTPQADDIKGIAKLYKEQFPDDKPGDPNAGAKFKLFAGLGLETAGAYDLKIALSGDAEKTGGKVQVCKGAPSECTDASSWTDATREGPKGDAVIFGLSAQTISAGKMTLRYKFDGGAAVQGVEFKPQT
jgi:hypothetical protein